MKKITFWTQLGRFSFSFRIKVLVSALTFLLFSFSVHAQHPYGFMDGNVMNDNGQLDWQDVYNNSGLPAGSISTGIQFDVMNPDDIFTGGSTKDHLPISGWFNKFQDASSSDKTNILQAGAILIDGKIYFSVTGFQMKELLISVSGFSRMMSMCLMVHLKEITRLEIFL